MRSAGRWARVAGLATGLLVLAGAVVTACGSGTPNGSGAGSTGGGGDTVTSAQQSTSSSSSTSTTSTSTTTPAAPPLGRGQQGPGSAIPWSKVGPGWTVALWNSAAASAQSTLFVVDPQGGRYAAATIATSPNSYPQISDWSGDKKRVLITSLTAGSSATTVTDIDLTTGATVGSFAVGGLGIASGVSFSRPDGLAIIAGAYPPQGGQITWRRYSPSGTVELKFPNAFTKVGKIGASALYTPDGTQVVFGTDAGLAVVENNGAVTAQLPVPSATSCQVLRWWQRSEVLAICTLHFGPEDFWAVPISGAAPTLVASVSQGAPFNVWQAGGGLYAQEGACGTVFIVKLAANGTQTGVTIPDTLSSDSEQLLGAYGNSLLVRATASCDTAAKPVQPSLLWYDVLKNTSTFILGTPINGGDVQSAFLYDSEGY